MRTSSEEIRQALSDYRDAVDIACQMEQELFIAEKNYEIHGNDETSDDRDAATQNLISVTVQHMHYQFELMKATKTLDVLIELAKVEVGNDRLLRRAS